MKSLLYSIAVIFCLSGFLFAEVTIDAFTSASTKFKIVSGKVLETSAEIVWWDYYSNGILQELKWGKTATYDSIKNLQDFTRQTNITTKITGLEPKTKYYAEFHRTYEKGSGSTLKTINLSHKFEFTTPEATTSTIPQPQLQKTTNIATGTHVALFSITGQRIAILATNRYLAASALFAGKVAPGLYIARVLDANNMPIHSYQCMIGR
jgi:hypothetical protein